MAITIPIYFRKRGCFVSSARAPSTWLFPFARNGDIAANIDVTFGAVSQHLRVLREAGIVNMTKRGRHHYYRANREALGPLAQYLEGMWLDRLRLLKQLVEAEERSK